MGGFLANRELDEKKVGYPYSSNQFWKMVRAGKTNNLLKQFQAGNIDCYQVIQESSGHTIVHQAIALDRRELLKLCQIYGADWNQTDANGVTPLMKAAGLNRAFFIDRLIQLGAKLDLTDPRGRTAVEYARFYENNEVAEMLQETMKKQRDSANK